MSNKFQDEYTSLSIKLVDIVRMRKRLEAEYLLEAMPHKNKIDELNTKYKPQFLELDEQEEALKEQINLLRELSNIKQDELFNAANAAQLSGDWDKVHEISSSLEQYTLHIGGKVFFRTYENLSLTDLNALPEELCMKMANWDLIKKKVGEGEEVPGVEVVKHTSVVVRDKDE